MKPNKTDSSTPLRSAQNDTVCAVKGAASSVMLSEGKETDSSVMLSEGKETDSFVMLSEGKETDSSVMLSEGDSRSRNISNDDRFFDSADAPLRMTESNPSRMTENIPSRMTENISSGTSSERNNNPSVSLNDSEGAESFCHVEQRQRDRFFCHVERRRQPQSKHLEGSLSGFQIMMQLLLFVKPLAGFMVLAVTLGVLGFLCAIAIPVLGVAALLIPEQWKMILAVLIAAALLRGILRYGEQLCNHYIAFRLLALLRDRIFAVLRKLCPAKLEGRNKGDLIAMITSDIELLEVFYAHTISPILIAICTSAILFVVQLQFHPHLALLALAAYLAVGLVLPVMNTKRGRESGRAYREGFGAMSSHMLDNLQGIEEVTQFGAGELRLDEMNDKVLQLGKLQKKMKHCEGLNKSITDCTILLFTAAQLVLACHLAQAGMIAAEQAAISAVLLMSSFGPVTALSSLSNNLLQTLASGQRVLGLLKETPETEENIDGVSVAFESAELQNVGFAYKDEEILKDFSLQIPKGTLLGIQGKSGSGKSTILKLLMRFWDVQTGSVLISDQNVKDIATKSLRDNQSYCTQETYLFTGTIAENISLGRPDATQEQIEDAAKKAALHEFIVSLPDGYSTMIGEKDNGLSGGQQQRIGLARIFLHDAPLMLLDEPTSNLDSLNESIILKSLRENKAGKTMILVSHRLSTLRIADEVFRMEQKRSS